MSKRKMETVATLTLPRNSMSKHDLAKVKRDYKKQGFNLIVIQYGPNSPAQPFVQIQSFIKG